LDWAAAEAAERGGGLTLFSCYEIPYAGESIGWAFGSPVEELLNGATAVAQEAARAVAATHPAVEVTTVVSAGPAARELVDMATPADLLVVGASGHRGLVAMLSSTPRTLVRHSPCPVVVVRGAASLGRPDRVVVGVDGSASAFGALEWAVAEADLHRVPLDVVHAWQYPYSVIGRASAREAMQVDAQLVLDEAVRFARERCLGTVTGTLEEGSPTDVILVSVRNGDLLVLAASGRGALTRGLLGSTVNSVLDRAAVPVTVVRRPTD
jgi:nucleotide-binding universal stress UspA family protein